MFCRVSAARTRVLTPVSANVCKRSSRAPLSFFLFAAIYRTLCQQEERTRAGDALGVDAIVPVYDIPKPVCSLDDSRKWKSNIGKHSNQFRPITLRNGTVGRNRDDNSGPTQSSPSLCRRR